MRAARSLRRIAVVAAMWMTPSLVARADDVPAAYVPRPEHDLSTLLDLVRRRSAGLQADLLVADLARADARQARLLNNPVVDATWGTIPIGETNPPNLGSPLTSIPSYSVGLSYTFPLGKRGPRQERSTAIAEGASLSAEASARVQALDLARVLGKIAVTRLRIDGLRSLAAQQRAVIELTRLRLQQGFGTPLDIDRLEIELSRSEQQVLVTEAEEQAGLTACAAYIGAPCKGIASAEDARALVLAWAKRASEGTPHVESRPDVRAIDAFQRASVAEADLARAQAIPDPTVRLGYTYDQFTISGNQANSLNLSLSLPITIFDHGQAQLQAAEARRARLQAQRALTLRSSTTRVAALRELLRLQQKRQEAIAKTLPRARAVLDDLQRAANGRLIPFTDVIQARRTLDELLVEEADSYSDSFQTSVDLIAEMGPAAP
ncbi:MAG: outer rane efflux protein [Labilithrix sp.]|nr:outer rane efflux protein [Labilithrix sp.]